MVCLTQDHGKNVKYFLNDECNITETFIFDDLNNIGQTSIHEEENGDFGMVALDD